MEIKEIIIHHIDDSYEVQFEQSAVKGVLGFKVKAVTNDLTKAQIEAAKLLGYAQEQAKLADLTAVKTMEVKNGIDKNNLNLSN